MRLGRVCGNLPRFTGVGASESSRGGVSIGVGAGEIDGVGTFDSTGVTADDSPEESSALSFLPRLGLRREPDRLTSFFDVLGCSLNCAASG